MIGKNGESWKRKHSERIGDLMPLKCKILT